MIFKNRSLFLIKVAIHSIETLYFSVLLGYLSIDPISLCFLSVLELAIVAPNFHWVTIHLFDIGINALRHTMHQ